MARMNIIQWVRRLGEQYLDSYVGIIGLVLMFTSSVVVTCLTIEIIPTAFN